MTDFFEQVKEALSDALTAYRKATEGGH